MVKKTKLVEFIRFFNPKTHKLIFKMPTVDSFSSLLDSEIRHSVPFSVYSEIYNAITGKELKSDGFSTYDFCINFLEQFEDNSEGTYCYPKDEKNFIDFCSEVVEITYPENADYYLVQWENNCGIWQNDNSFKTLEQALEYCDNDLNKYELMRIIPQYFGKYFQEEPKERGI
jgi:hypothetical protein|nr:MAG TPA: hypothetical protein [Caudoviricetes sp.]